MFTFSTCVGDSVGVGDGVGDGGVVAACVGGVLDVATLVFPLLPADVASENMATPPKIISATTI